MRTAQILTLVWIIACGILILFWKFPVPYPGPCINCRNFGAIFGIASIVIGVAGLIAIFLTPRAKNSTTVAG